MYSLETITSLQDLVITLKLGSRSLRFHVYQHKGSVHADTIQNVNFDNTTLIKDILIDPKHGITALLHQGYIVNCAPVKKGSKLK